MEIKRPNMPQDGPADGVMGVVECIRTDFLENPAEGEAAFQQRDKSQAHITARIFLFFIKSSILYSSITLLLQNTNLFFVSISFLYALVITYFI